MTESGGSEASFSLRTAWAQYHQTPLRRFLRTETGSAAVLLAATLAALVWANVDSSGYEAAWGTGKRHHGAYDIDTLAAAVLAARARTLIGSAPRRRRSAVRTRNDDP